MSATRSIPLTALALAVGLMAHGTASAQDHSQHQMPAPPAAQDHSQHQAAKKPVTRKKATAPVAAKPASTGHAGHAGDSAPTAVKAVAKPAKKKVAPAPASHAAHSSAPASEPAASKAAADPHAGMDHGAQDVPVAEMDHAAMGHEMPMAPAPATGMDHSAMGHAAPASPEQPLTPIPAVTDADRAAAFPDLQRHMEHASEVNSYVLFNRLEAWDADPGTGQAWEALAWIGTDLDRVWLRSEGERVAGHTEAADLEVLYGRSVSPWWDVVAGIKHDFQPGPSQTWAAFGVQGLSPYKFEVQATAYVGESGQTAANFEVEYETLLTNRLILQSLVEIDLYGKDDARRGIGSGLSTVEAALRLRYEFTRKFAPFIGIVHERAYGGTADFRRIEGEDTQDTRVVAGIRIWF